MKGISVWECSCGNRKCTDCNPEGKDLGTSVKDGLAFRESLGHIDGATVQSEDLTDKQYKRDKTNQDQGSVF